jgi:rRNA maturation RNase YbeY
MNIRFHFTSKITLRERKRLKAFLLTISQTEGKSLDSLDIIFCSDEKLLEINQAYLHHDYYTDIITFDLRPNHQLPIQGELYISTDRVKENASTLDQKINFELHRVIFHGLLHLCGYKDKKPADKIQMTLKENEYLSAYFK